jgi:hypothetical protein
LREASSSGGNADRRWPSWVGDQAVGLRLPLGHVGTQRIGGRLGVAPGLGGQHLDALGQQHGRLALHLHPVLQVLDALDAVGQRAFSAGQRLAAEGRAGLGGVALPGHRIGDVHARLTQQGLGLLRPFGGDDLLALAALDLVQRSRSRRAAPLSRALSSR